VVEAEDAPPERLRDRLINVEKTFVEHERRMKLQDKEVASLVIRIKHLETMLFEQGPIILSDSKGAKRKRIKENIKPYRYNGY